MSFDSVVDANRGCTGFQPFATRLAAAEIAATASAAAVCASDGVSSSSAATFSDATGSSSTASTGDAACAAAVAAMAATASRALTADRDLSNAFEDPSTGVAGSESPSSEKPSVSISSGGSPDGAPTL